MEQWLGSTWGGFIGLAVPIGSAAFLTGQAIANIWRPAWQVCAYCLLLGLLWRFLSYALFAGQLLSLSGFVVNVSILIAIGWGSYRITHVNRMVSQYPWLYRRRGLWAYEQLSP